MFHRISDKLILLSGTGFTCVASLLFAGSIAFILPDLALQMAEASSGLGSPDTRLFYSPGTLYQLAQVYGISGRETYIATRLQYDTIWPLVYTLFFVTAISRTFSALVHRRVIPATSRIRLVNLLPLGALLFDYLENLFVSLFMAGFPEHNTVWACLATLSTSSKWLFVGISLFALFAMLFCLILVLRHSPSEQKG